jgi:hypothetical protein
MATSNRPTQLDLFGETPTPPSSISPIADSAVSASPVRNPIVEKNGSAKHDSIKPRRGISAKNRLRAHRKRLKAAGLSRIETAVDATTLRVLQAVALAQNKGSASRMAGEVLKQWALRQRLSEN